MSWFSVSLNNGFLESLFLIGGTVVVLGFLVLLFLSSAWSYGQGNFKFDPSVPAEYQFRPPQSDGKARIGGETFRSLAGALRRVQSGETIYLSGTLRGPVTVETDGVTLVGTTDTPPLIMGRGEGNVVTVTGRNVTLRNIWVRNSGFDPSENDAGIWIGSDGTRIVESRISKVTFGIWIDGAQDVLVKDNTIVGRESVYPISSRGNGIQLWKTEDSLVTGNRITDVRDGIYYSWAEEVLARDNIMWDLRYGVHYMYSDDCTLKQNLAFNNDSGYALMVSQNLKLIGNVAVNNRGQSGHGILLKSIDRTVLRRNTLVRNGDGLYIYNSLDNEVTWNLVLGNEIGVHLTAGSVDEEVHHNTFISNGESVRATVGQQVVWSTENVGNFWSEAQTVDVDGDGVSDIRYQPAGLIEQLMVRAPLTKLFASSPAFAAIRLAESSVPVVDSNGVMDYHPLVHPTRSNWRQYYE